MDSMKLFWCAALAAGALSAQTFSGAAALDEVINQAIVNGALPAAPREDGCKNCEYLPVCGPYEEERVKEKSQAELRGLKEMRGWR